MGKILFVRHGKSMANANLTVGEPDTPLAEEGLEQARITGMDLRGHNVAKIVCSPYIRAQQTAEIIAGELGILIGDIVVIDELHERRMGDLEGGPKTYDTAYYYENDTDHGFESRHDLIIRMQNALEKVKAVAAGTSGAVVVVGHATSGFYIQQIAKGNTEFADFEPFNQMGNAEFVEVEQ
jgi:probable phosphoglycerate mutase